MFSSLNTGCDIVVIPGDVAGVAVSCAADSWAANSDEAQVVFLSLPWRDRVQSRCPRVYRVSVFRRGKSRSPDALVQFSKRLEFIWLSSEVLKFVQPLGAGGNFGCKTQELPPQPPIEMCSCGKLLKGPFGRGEANAVVRLLIAVEVVDLFSKIGFTRVVGFFSKTGQEWQYTEFPRGSTQTPQRDCSH
jgi:hypothetical protein